MYGSQRPAGPARPEGLVRLAEPVTDLLLIIFVAQRNILVFAEGCAPKCGKNCLFGNRSASNVVKQ